MAKLIIVEGPDRCFKSSAIEHIRKNLIKDPRIITIHSSSPPRVTNVEEWTNAHYLHLINQMITNRGVMILDRSHLGEHVYGTLYRGGKCSNSIFNYDKVLENEDAQLILLTDTVENRLSREDGLSQSKLNTDLMQQEHNLFLEAFERTSIKNKIHIHAKQPEEIIQLINKFIGETND